MKVRYSDLALAELEAIYDDLNRRDPQAAHRFADRLLQINEQIEMFPYGFQRVPQRQGVRRAPFIHFPYLLFYTLRNDEAVVVRVAHGARKEPWENL
jgi:plasmid stabilization system protein ParE